MAITRIRTGKKNESLWKSLCGNWNMESFKTNKETLEAGSCSCFKSCNDRLPKDRKLEG